MEPGEERVFETFAPFKVVQNTLRLQGGNMQMSAKEQQHY